MELEQKLDRRSFLKRASSLGAVALAAPALMTIVGCSKKADDGGSGADTGDGAGVSCDDASQIDDDSKSMRATLKYVEKSDVDGQDCANCQFYHDGADGCGTCDLFTGPVNPKGHCTSWSKKMG